MAEPWTYAEAKGLGGRFMIIKRDEFRPPSWQIWDANGDQLLAAFATRELLYAGLPAVRNYLRERG